MFKRRKIKIGGYLYMVALLELKEKVKKIYGMYDVYIIPGAKFLMSLISLSLINGSIGYMSKIKNPLIAVFVSILCAFLPNGFTIVCLSAFVVAHLYAASAELAVVSLCLFLLMYLLYFRFTPKSGYILIITAILCWIKLPYLVPIAIGLTSGILAVIPASFGIMVYYIIKTASEYQTAITSESASNSVQKFSFIVNSLLNNKEMILLVVAVAISILVVYAIRRLSVENAWSYAVLSGALAQFIILVVGKLAWSAKIDMIFVIIGTVLTVILGYLLQILFFSVDYKRTESVQYEDDDYYYYVKAVPKVNIVNQEVKVKRINAQKVKKTDDIKRDQKYDSTKLSNKTSNKNIEDSFDEDYTIPSIDK